jgi:predicted RNase H-like HicB family nuclease
MLNWTYTIEQDSHEGCPFYIIRVNELPGICTDAESVEEGLIEIQSAIKAACQLYIQNEEDIPGSKP